MKKIYMLMVGLMIALAANAADWFISGAFQGWNHCNAKYQFTETESGIYKLTLPEYKGSKAISGEFLIVAGTVGKPDWNNQIGSNGSKVKEGTPYNYTVGGGNFNMDGQVDDAVITIDTNNKTLLIEGAAKENEYTTVYLVGDMGGGWDEARTDYPMTLKAGTDDTWTASYNLTAANNYFKMRAGTQAYGTGEGDVNIVMNQAYTASQSGNSFVLPAGEYDFTFVLPYNGETGTLTVTGKEDVTYPETVYVIGNINNLDFLPNNTVALQAKDVENGLYEGEVTFTGTLDSGYSYFQLCTATGADATDWAGLGNRYGATESDVDPIGINGVEITRNDFSWKVKDDTYNITVDLKNMNLKVAVGSGVEGVAVDENAACEYFNLQGLRVNNPVEGQIYIVRQGSKVTKIVR